MTEQDKNISSDEQIDPVIAAVREEYEKKIADLKEEHKKSLKRVNKNTWHRSVH